MPGLGGRVSDQCDQCFVQPASTFIAIPARCRHTQPVGTTGYSAVTAARNISAGGPMQGPVNNGSDESLENLQSLVQRKVYFYRTFRGFDFPVGE